MIKATAKGPDGRDILVIGLSYGNLDHFRAHPRDSFIKIPSSETGIPVEVVIFSGETEAHCAEMIKEFSGPDTKVTTGDRVAAVERELRKRSAKS